MSTEADNAARSIGISECERLEQKDRYTAQDTARHGLGCNLDQIAGYRKHSKCVHHDRRRWLVAHTPAAALESSTMASLAVAASNSRFFLRG